MQIWFLIWKSQLNSKGCSYAQSPYGKSIGEGLAKVNHLPMQVVSDFRITAHSFLIMRIVEHAEGALSFRARIASRRNTRLNAPRKSRSHGMFAPGILEARYRHHWLGVSLTIKVSRKLAVGAAQSPEWQTPQNALKRRKSTCRRAR